MLQLVRTDYSQRWHLFVDTQAAKFDAFRVELLEQSIFLSGDSVEALWQRVPAAMQDMQREYDRLPLYHGFLLAPFARIVAVEFARESAECALKTSMVVGELHPGHEERVRALGQALDALEFLGSQQPRKTADLH